MTAAAVYNNRGDLIEARRWWRTARLAADRSADPYTMLWVRGREVVRAGYECRPVPVILQLASQAETRLDGVPPEALSEFFTGKAQTLALAGRHTEAYSGQHYRSCDTHLELQRSAVDQDR
jgi:hypothetical protein